MATPVVDLRIESRRRLLGPLAVAVHRGVPIRDPKRRRAYADAAMRWSRELDIDMLGPRMEHRLGDLVARLRRP